MMLGQEDVSIPEFPIDLNTGSDIPDVPAPIDTWEPSPGTVAVADKVDVGGMDWGAALQKIAQFAGTLAPAAAQIIAATRGNQTTAPFGTKVIRGSDGRLYYQYANGALVPIGTTSTTSGLFGTASTGTLLLLAVGAFLLLRK